MNLHLSGYCHVYTPTCFLFALSSFNCSTQVDSVDKLIMTNYFSLKGCVFGSAVDVKVVLVDNR